MKSASKKASSKTIKLSDYVAEFLVRHGIEQSFVFTGGAISHILDSIFTRHLRDGDMNEPICVMHEQAGSMALDAYTRATGKIGVMAVTSGPGATNLLTGIACSYYDSIPGLYFTGQVAVPEYKGKSKQRQVGFQETDIVTLAKPLVKYSAMVTRPEDIRYELEKALHLATEGRPGPVLLDLPMDIQQVQIDPKKLRSYKLPTKRRKSIKKQVNTAAKWLRAAKRPMIITGGGVRIADAAKELRELAELCDMPVGATYNGVDTFPHDDHRYVGILGSMGNRGTNLCLAESDMVLAVGSRLTLRQVRSKPKEFVSGKKLVHVDIDAHELNQRVRSDLAIVADAKEFLTMLIEVLRQDDCPRFSKWSVKARRLFTGNPACKPEYSRKKRPVNPYVFIKALSGQMADNDILIGDCGQSLIFTYQAAIVRGEQQLFTAGAHSPMGYSLPAAIGPAAVYREGSPRIICTIGDGSTQLNIQELQTIHSYDLPIKIFITNNHAYGAIQDYQDAKLEGRHFASAPGHGYEPPDILAIARAYKIPTASITSHQNLEKQIKDVLNTKGPVVCDVDMGSRTPVTLDP
ncbi:MAG: thiamine pyrophosphate-binding protein [Patescibacteria group bacterium]|nr:thiamine pyrophosphate-binding protein [Patescibacteria group bacterium]